MLCRGACRARAWPATCPSMWPAVVKPTDKPEKSAHVSRCGPGRRAGSPPKRGARAGGRVAAPSKHDVHAASHPFELVAAIIGRASTARAHLLFVSVSLHRTPYQLCAHERAGQPLARATPSIDRYRSVPWHSDGPLAPARAVIAESSGVTTISFRRQVARDWVSAAGGLNRAPSGTTPCSTYRHKSIINRRATATMPILRPRTPLLAHRAAYQRASALCG